MKILTKKAQHETVAKLMKIEKCINKYPSATKEEQVIIYDEISENICSLVVDIGGIDLAYSAFGQALIEAHENANKRRKKDDQDN